MKKAEINWHIVMILVILFSLGHFLYTYPSRIERITQEVRDQTRLETADLCSQTYLDYVCNNYTGEVFIGCSGSKGKQQDIWTVNRSTFNCTKDYDREHGWFLTAEDVPWKSMNLTNRTARNCIIIQTLPTEKIFEACGANLTNSYKPSVV